MIIFQKKPSISKQKALGHCSIYMWYDTYYKNRKALLSFFVILSILALFLIPRLKFAFNFEQFFPQGDEDLIFFQEFIAEFETDDNFLLIALEHEPSVFDTAYLKKVKAFSKAIEKEVPYVKLVQALPDFRYPVMTPFGPSTIPALHLNDPKLLKEDSIRLMNDERIMHNLLNIQANSSVVIIKTEDNVLLTESKEIMTAVRLQLDKYGFTDYHMLGRPYFQADLAVLQAREIIISTIISSILICIVMVLIFRRWVSILIALGSIGVGLVIFMGVLSLWGRELSLMAALYPVLMLIVGTSDVVHMMTKYIDELKKGHARKEALELTIKQIGMATLLTSLTTAAGFATLLSSKIGPIQDFGINSALGVLIAYIVVICFTCPLLSFFTKEQLVPPVSKERWSGVLTKAYNYSLHNAKTIYIATFICLILFAIGISKIHTNYDLYNNLPKGAQISEDFLYFEKEYAGFRPLELAGTIQEGYSIYDYEVLDAVDKAENHMKSRPQIQTAFSLSTMAKSLNQMVKGPQQENYRMPTEKEYPKIKRLLSSVPNIGADVLISKDKRKTRVSTKVKDIGAENIKALSRDVDKWIAKNIDPKVIKFKQTGTGLLLDKNSEFVKDSLLQGLLIALLLVSILMGLLFRDVKMLFLALVPNVIPLLFAAALIGYTGVALEAGVSIVFAIIFGIAVDDTIHFLSKYKLAKDQYGDREKALEVTFQECGKAIIFTTIILFFGFLVLLFSTNEPSMVIGMLISVTLLSALIADLTILPVLIRRFKI